MIRNPVAKKIIAIFAIGSASWLIFFHIIKPLTERVNNWWFAILLAVGLVVLAKATVGDWIKY